MQITSTIALLAFGAFASAAPSEEKQGLRLPENLPDGHYFGDGTIDPETGFARYTFLAPIDWNQVDEFKVIVANATAVADTEIAAPSKDKRAEGPKCNGRNAGDSVLDAMWAFAVRLPIQNTSRGFYSSISGTSRAYACVYTAGQPIRYEVFWSDMANVNAHCGEPNSGWFSHASGGVDYGRDNLSYKFCGF